MNRIHHIGWEDAGTPREKPHIDRAASVPSYIHQTKLQVIYMHAILQGQTITVYTSIVP